MRPFRYSSAWAVRSADALPYMAVKRKFFFICEGENTERYYFEGLIAKRTELGVCPLLGLTVVERTDEDKSKSAPPCLLEHADKVSQDALSSFDVDNDVFVFVFDLDIYKRKGKLRHYESFIREIENKPYKYRLAVSQPNFELFLLLHLKDSYKSIVEPQAMQIMAPKKGKRHILEQLVSEHMGINSKSNESVSACSADVQTAIAQEREWLSRDFSSSSVVTKLTCTVGQCIEEILTAKS